MTHELTLTALDPAKDWGAVKLACSECGPCGVHPDPYAAYVAHARLGAAAVQHSVDRGQAIGRSLRYRR